MSCSWLFEDRTETWLTIAVLVISRLSITVKASSSASCERDVAIKNCDPPVFQNQDITLAEFINQNDIEEGTV